MKRRQLVVILVSILVIILILTVILVKISPKERCERKYSEFNDLYLEKLYRGYDLSEAENVAKNAKEAYNMGDYESAMRFLDEAIIALEGAKKATPIMLPVTWTEEEYIDYVLPSPTKEQIQHVINNKSLKQNLIMRLEDVQEYYDKKRDEIVKLRLQHEEKERALKATDNVIKSITQLRDIDTRDIDIIYADYNKLRSSVIQEYQLEQEFRKKYLEPGCDAFIATYTPQGYHPMKFGADLISACFWHISKNTLEDIKNEMAIIDEVGCDFVVICVDYDWWIDSEKSLSENRIAYKENTEIIQKLDKVVEEVRNRNMSLYLVPMAIDRWYGEPGELGPAPFDLWKEVYLDEVKKITARYKPDYISIGHEAPTLFSRQVNRHVSASEWVEVVEESVKWVKQNYPNATVITALAPTQSNVDFFYALIQKDIDIDVFGINPYSLPQILFFDNSLQYEGKEFWITETWDNSKGKYLDNLADKYIIASTNYAQSKEFRGYTIFYGNHLHTKDFNKTPAFYTYKRAIEDVCNNTK